MCVPNTQGSVPPIAGGVGTFVSWEGGCLFIGEKVGLVPVHAHYAIQVVFGSEHGVRLRPDDRLPWQEFGGAMIASRQPHTMDASRVRVNAVMFIEPETREGRALTERYLDAGIVPFPDGAFEATAAVIEAWDRRDSTALVGRARRDRCAHRRGGTRACDGRTPAPGRALHQPAPEWSVDP